MTITTKTLRAMMPTALVAALLAPPLTTATAPSRADPVMHHVKYTITAGQPIYADIYYIDHDPAIYADYSANPYRFAPNVQADIAPGRPWVQEVDLANPNDWAMVSVSVGGEPSAPNFHCSLAVDGAVVASNDGPRGALCSLRNW